MGEYACWPRLVMILCTVGLPFAEQTGRAATVAA
jgi:hypothetical protein